MAGSRRSVDYRVDPFDLRLFTAVLEHGSITAAAQAVSLSLAAASARMQALESLVGTQLLARSKTGAVPTDAGRALARHAHRVLAELEALHADVASFAKGLRGSVRLLCNTAAMAEALPPRLGPFLNQHPDIDVELQELPSDAVLEALRRGVADVGIVADYADSRGLDSRPWLEDQLVALLPRGWFPGSRQTARFVELLDMPFVGLSLASGLSRFLVQQAGRSGHVPHHRVRVSSFDAVAQIVAAGVGVAVMPISAASRWRSARVRLVPLSDAWAHRRLLICTTTEAKRQPSIELLVEALLAT
jgi:molybdate transport repressor ModE-like protein